MKNTGIGSETANVNIKNSSFSIMLTATDKKQKIIKR